MCVLSLLAIHVLYTIYNIIHIVVGTYTFWIALGWHLNIKSITLWVMDLMFRYLPNATNHVGSSVVVVVEMEMEMEGRKVNATMVAVVVVVGKVDHMKFPRQRKTTSFSITVPTVSTRWKLSMHSVSYMITWLCVTQTFQKSSLIEQTCQSSLLDQFFERYRPTAL